MNSIASGVALCLAATILVLAPSASAQSTPPADPARRPDPLKPQAQVPPLVYSSAFRGYRPNAETGVGSWTGANQAVQQAGGWRAYAREARPADAAPPAASAPAGHAHH
jgi:hypothetical protein